jgi:hypothetical protein
MCTRCSHISHVHVCTYVNKCELIKMFVVCQRKQRKSVYNSCAFLHAKQLSMWRPSLSFLYSNAGLPGRSQFAPGRKVLQATNSIKVSEVFFGPKSTAHLLPKIHVALRASRAALTNRIKVSRQWCPTDTKFSQNSHLLSLTVHCEQSTSCHSNFVPSQRFTFSSLPLPQGRAGTYYWEPSK